MPSDDIRSNSANLLPPLVTLRIHRHLQDTIASKGAGLLVLVDPDRLDEHQLPRFAELCQEAEVDALLNKTTSVK